MSCSNLRSAANSRFSNFSCNDLLTKDSNSSIRPTKLSSFVPSLTCIKFNFSWISLMRCSCESATKDACRAILETSKSSDFCLANASCALCFSARSFSAIRRASCMDASSSRSLTARAENSLGANKFGTLLGISRRKSKPWTYSGPLLCSSNEPPVLLLLLLLLLPFLLFLFPYSPKPSSAYPGLSSVCVRDLA